MSGCGNVHAGTDFGSAGAGADSGFYGDDEYNRKQTNEMADASDHIVDIREYDVPYHVRVAIDKGLLFSRLPQCASE